MRLISLLILLVISNATLFCQICSTKDLLLRMYNAESDEACIKAFYDIQGLSEEQLNAENDTVQYLFHYCYAGGLDLVNGDKTVKIQHINKALKIRETKLGIFSSEYLELQWALGNEIENNDVDKAINIYEEALIKGQYLFIKAKSNPSVRYWYGQCLTSLAHCFEIKKYHKQVVQAYRAAFSVLKDQYDKDDASSYLPLCQLAFYYSHQCKDYDKSISVMNEVMQYIKEHEGENNKKYVGCLYSVATDLGKQKNYDQAIEYYNKAINILKNCYSEYDVDMGRNYCNLFLLYVEQGNIEKALELRPLLMNYYQHNNQGTEYYKMLWAASKIVPKEKTQKFFKKIYAEFNNFTDNQKIDLYLQMAETSLYEKNKNEQNNALKNMNEISEWLSEACKLSEPIYGTNDIRYLRCLYGYADFNLLKGDSIASLKSLYSVRNMLQKIQADTTALYGNTLNRIDFMLSSMKDYKGGINNGLELYKFTITKFGKESRKYGNVVNTLGVYYMNDGNYRSAKTYIEEACDVFLKSDGEQSVAYEIALHNLGKVEMLQGNKKKAIKLLQKSRRLQMQYQKTVNPKTEQYLQELSAK